MKTIKKMSILLCVACSMGMHAMADSVNGKTEKAILSYFAEQLKEEDAEFENEKKLKLSDIEKYRKVVWNLWKEANNRFEEEKLAPLAPLSEKTASRWNLPAELEPNAVMPYYWGVKGSEQPAEGLPLFLYIHGSGPKQGEWATGLKICSMFDDAPSAYFIPQIPNEGNYYRWWQKAKQFAWKKLLRQTLASGAINPNRVYIFGISEGGYGSQRLASFYADYLAAAGPMAGGEPLKNAPVENCANIGFSLRTGDRDYGFYRNMLTAYTKHTFDSLQAQHPKHFEHFIELIPGMGHHIDYRPTTPWLKKFVRNPYPKYVSWENFEMDGWYRDAFYNLCVKERSNDDDKTRTHYEMKIEGNHITLNVNEVVYQTTQKDPQWGIELKFVKKYTPAHEGKVLIYLCNELVDLSKPVTVTLNGKKVFSGKVKPNLEHMVNSCATFFDPARIYPAAIEVELD